MKITLCTVVGCRSFGKYCRQHLTDTVKETNPIAKASDDRKELDKEYKKLRVVFLRQNPMCAEKGCNQPATDIHHASGKVGEKLIDVKDFVPLCRKHHSYYEIRPVEAKQKGISKSRLGKSKKSVV